MKFLLAAALAAATGCAGQRGLRVAGAERVCPGGTAGSYCFLRADAGVVDDRCKRGFRRWDSGETDPQAHRARCCTVFRGWGKRYAIWVARGDEECLPHEFCHVDKFERGLTDHGACHPVGWGKSG